MRSLSYRTFGAAAILSLPLCWCVTACGGSDDGSSTDMLRDGDDAQDDQADDTPDDVMNDSDLPDDVVPDDVMQDDVLPDDIQGDDVQGDDAEDPPDDTPPPDDTVNQPPNTMTPTGLLEELIPFQEWPALGADQVGLLYEGQLNEFYAFSHGRGAGENQQSDRYRFAANGSSPYVLYFESTGDGFNFLQNWRVPTNDGGEDAVYDAAQFGPADLNRWGVSKPAHLVRMTINDGRGGTGLHFVGTDAELLDGTAEYPLDTTQVLADAAAQAAALFDAEAFAAAVEAEGEAAKAELDNPDAGMHEPAGSVLGFLPSWNEDEQTLSVIFVQREAGQWVEYGAMVTDNVNCPPGAPCAQPPPTYEATISAYGLEQAVVYTFSSAGELTDEASYPPQPVPFAGVTQTVREQFF